MTVRLKLNLRDLSIPEKVAKALQIVEALNGNADFPNPSPPLATVRTIINELNTAFKEALEARQVSKTKTSAQNNKEDIFDQTMSQIGSYIESVAGQDEQKLLSAGVGAATPATRSSDTPEVPANLSATAGDLEGEIDLTWDKMARARSYKIEMTLDPHAGQWTNVDVSAVSKHTVKGLTSGTRYWFRVASVGLGGQSGWSESAMRMAP
jgi:hypothetical protein